VGEGPGEQRGVRQALKANMTRSAGGRRLAAPARLHLDGRQGRPAEAIDLASSTRCCPSRPTSPDSSNRSSHYPRRPSSSAAGGGNALRPPHPWWSDCPHNRSHSASRSPALLGAVGLLSFCPSGN
jgi:hypothetical protein